MDSEDSRPGSSASNSSSNSSQISRQSVHHYSDPKNEIHSAGESATSSSRSRHSRRSGSIYEGSHHSRSKSDSDSSSSISLSDDGEDEETKSSINANLEKKSNSGCSEIDQVTENKVNLSTIPSPASQHSSRESSLSSDCSRSISGERQQENNELNITHEDLSDVSDLESEKRTSLFKMKPSEVDQNTDDVKDVVNINEYETNEKKTSDLRQKLEKKKYQLNESCVTPPKDDENILPKDKTKESLEDLVKPHDEDALDFEAEEGECHETSKNDGKQESEKDNNTIEEKNNLQNNCKNSEEELEEGEVSDEDEKRPEETEPKPVCRFYTRGQCTWGMSCRFLHPGVTDKGNYTMFDLVRPVPLPPSASAVGNRASNFSIHAVDFHDFRSERPAIHHRNSSLHHNANVYPSNNETRKVTIDGPVVVESAWERGLRTAKEMMRKACKRKEQDMDFEDKKMNLTLSPDELEKDPYYLKDRISPTETARHPLYESATDVYNSGDRYGRGPPLTHYDEIDPYGRSTRYRELPPHRMPQYEDERRVRPAREVIVQRVEPLGRSDDWNDPWMRSKSPNGRGGSREHGDKRRRDRRSYSSNSSYTSSSSSQSDSSSDSSRSLSPRDRHRRRYDSSSHKVSPSATRRAGGRNMRSLTPPPKKSRGLSSLLQSPNMKRKTNISSPPYNRDSAYSPAHKRKRLSPLTKKIRGDKSKIKHRHSSSSSDSDSTGSETETDTGSSSSDSSSQSQDLTPPKRLRGSDKLASNERKGLKKDLPKKRSPISIELRKPATVGVSALSSPAHAAPIEKDSKKSRREELLKQLRAVEDAIAKKRSKLV